MWKCLVNIEVRMMLHYKSVGPSSSVKCAAQKWVSLTTHHSSMRANIGDDGNIALYTAYTNIHMRSANTTKPPSLAFDWCTECNLNLKSADAVVTFIVCTHAIFNWKARHFPIRKYNRIRSLQGKISLLWFRNSLALKSDTIILTILLDSFMDWLNFHEKDRFHDELSSSIRLVNFNREFDTYWNLVYYRMDSWPPKHHHAVSH